MNSTETTTKSFFLVEDEVLIRMMLVDMIEELGHSVVAEAGSLAEALPLARDAVFDIAILDINLGGGTTSAAIADVVAKREILLFYASRYGSIGAPYAFKEGPVANRSIWMI